MAQGDVNSYKLLVIDNEALILEELADFFISHDYSCVTCEDPFEALEMFREDPGINIVLSDIYMPGMSGMELINQMKSLNNQRIFESVLLSGQSSKQDIIDALQYGISDYLSKPLELDKTLASIGRLCQKIDQRLETRSLEQISQRLNSISTLLQEVTQDIGRIKQPAPSPAQHTELDLPQISVEKLSPRQLEVARLIGKGLTNYQISFELALSENTVKLYVSQILRATNLKNRTQLALMLRGSEQRSSV